MTESIPMTAVPFAAANRASQTFQRSLLVQGTVDSVAARLSDAIEAEGIWVLHEINPQMLLARGGYAIAAARTLLPRGPQWEIAQIVGGTPGELVTLDVGRDET